MTPENWWLENLFVFGKAYCSAGMLVLAKVVPLEFLKPDLKASWVFQVFFWGMYTLQIFLVFERFTFYLRSSESRLEILRWKNNPSMAINHLSTGMYFLDAFWCDILHRNSSIFKKLQFIYCYLGPRWAPTNQFHQGAHNSTYFGFF